jgi:hypothetical protein
VNGHVSAKRSPPLSLVDDDRVLCQIVCVQRLQHTPDLQIHLLDHAPIGLLRPAVEIKQPFPEPTLGPPAARLRVPPLVQRTAVDELGYQVLAAVILNLVIRNGLRYNPKQTTYQSDVDVTTIRDGRPAPPTLPQVFG